MLSAIALDGNNEMFPLAWAIMHKAIDKACEKLWPEVGRRFCAKHLNLRKVSMVRLATRKELCEQWERSDICPNILKRVQLLCSDFRTCRAYLSGKGEYEIGDGKSQLAVSLNNHTRQCNQWQLTGIPCKHGMRAILHAGLDPTKFVHEWYSVQRYKMAYGAAIKAIPDKEQWPQNDHPMIQPPALKRRVGRPVKNRKKRSRRTEKRKKKQDIQSGR
ncbi:30S ribosomal protein S19 chloroplastic, partial [Bienertia sinuspersici]